MGLESEGVRREVAHTTETSSAGGGAVRLLLADPGGGGVVWIQRAFVVEPQRAYRMDMTFDAAGAHPADPWRLVAGVGPVAPEAAAALAVLDPVPTGDGAPTWEARSGSVVATSDEEGTLVVALGVWSTSAGDRVHYLDNVRLVFTRAD